MKRTIKTLAVAGVFSGVAVAAVAYFGVINVGADDPHFKVVHSFLGMVRERSVAVRSNDIEVPDLNDQAMIQAGAGNYNSMCVDCHLAPGVAETELSQALYPAPPNLAKKGIGENPAAAFWVIKHGIKATGMPAWGKSMQDPYIWGMVAFIKQLPQLDKTQYQRLVASSSGHQHGGGETQMHDHEGQHGADRNPAQHAQHEAQSPGEVHHAVDSDGQVNTPEPASNSHTHADGKVHKHED
ncbi:MAG: cytochrome C [Pseudomonadaceae bacterium]|nr:cytochrome C [Pseudomonadaceae bacterium]